MKNNSISNNSKSKDSEDYLVKISPLLQKLMIELLQNRPSNPVNL